MRDDLSSILKHQRDIVDGEANANLWMHVCYRFDILALIVFNALNLVLFFVYACA
jgi:hypothetical protein